eukprot:CAMPEP_0194041550 /NCGR_PEP_ID=MMETSP0009_2-20130614/13445_1 /TAXON_ID=210454 /ORGANISM="Grammatophora oceanica, Strain CCMP 410" /LENGTH=74 /DNA_ID=CAMNT_0038685101 /DNA_START=101 /DNA_END=322 /DNA_ORIENTATION=-
MTLRRIHADSHEPKYHRQPLDELIPIRRPGRNSTGGAEIVLNVAWMDRRSKGRPTMYTEGGISEALRDNSKPLP